jgi:hypothetical protein
MHSHLTHSQVPRALAIEPAHDDLLSGRGVMAMPTHDEIARVGGDVRYVVLLNHGRTAQEVCDIHGDDLLAKTTIDGQTTLAPFGVAIVRCA